MILSDFRKYTPAPALVDHRGLHPVSDGGELSVQPFFFHRGQGGPADKRGVLRFSQAEHATHAPVSGTGQMVVTRSLVVQKRRRRSVLSSTTIRRRGKESDAAAAGPTTVACRDTTTATPRR